MVFTQLLAITENMKIIYSTIFLLLLTSNLSGQKLPDFDQRVNRIEISMLPDADKKQPFLIISDTKAIWTSDLKGDDTKWIEIANHQRIIEKIKTIITFNFIADLNRCCIENECPDASSGIWIMFDKDEKREFVTLQDEFLKENSCGSKKLNDIISLFIEIQNITVNRR